MVKLELHNSMTRGSINVSGDNDFIMNIKYTVAPKIFGPLLVENKLTDMLPFKRLGCQK